MTDSDNQFTGNLARRVREHTELYRRDPEKAHLWDSTVIGIPGPITTLLLITTGRKSGEERFAALQYFRPEGDYVVIGSKAGMPKHPDWYLNLVANPGCEIQVGASRFRARARTAEGEERERLWAAVSAEQPEYVKYQARAERQIPVIVFDLIEEKQE